MFPQSACHCRCIITLVAFVRFVSTKASKHLLVQMLHFGFAFEFVWNLHDSNLLSATNLLYSIKKISILVYSVKVRGIKQTLSKGQQECFFSYMADQIEFVFVLIRNQYLGNSDYSCVFENINMNIKHHIQS